MRGTRLWGLLALSLVCRSWAQEAAPSTKQIAFELGSKLSLAGLGYDRGAPQEAVDSMLEKARVLAGALGAEVPALPQKTGDSAGDSAAVLHYLLKDAGGSIGKTLKEKHGAAQSDLFELSLKSNLLLLLYSPDGSEGASIASVIQSRGERLGLPESAWKPVVDLIGAKASFDDVKAAVSKMHEEVRRHLKDSP